MDHDDLNGAIQEMVARTGDGRIQMSRRDLAMDPMPAITLYEAID